MQRVSIVGNSGSGKSALGRRIAAVIDAPYIELDDIHHLEHWTPIDPALFTQQVTAVCLRSRWVIDGNYRRVTVDGPIWENADTVIWLHLPRRIVMQQIIRRTIRRVSTREELWNKNREPWGNLYRWNPEKSVIRWAWTQHRKYDERYGAAMKDKKYRHLRFIELQFQRRKTFLIPLQPSRNELGVDGSGPMRQAVNDVFRYRPPSSLVDEHPTYRCSSKPSCPSGPGVFCCHPLVTILLPLLPL